MRNYMVFKFKIGIFKILAVNPKIDAIVIAVFEVEINKNEETAYELFPLKDGNSTPFRY